MKITPYQIVKGFRYLKFYGPKAFWERLRDKMEPEVVPYGSWFEHYKASAEELDRQKKQEKKFAYRPVISIVVPNEETTENYLAEMKESVNQQSYSNWQLCMADTVDAGIEMASGEWIAFLNPDDLLAPEALFEMVVKMNQNPEFEVIYSDEDKIIRNEKGNWEHTKPQFKPEFSIDLLRSNNYMAHFLCVKKNVVEKTGRFHWKFTEAQYYDFVLRCTEIAKKVGHVAKVLYHCNSASQVYNCEAEQHIIEEHLKRVGQPGSVSPLNHVGFYRVKYQVQGKPLVSILIPNKDQAETLRRCVNSIEKSTYQNFEVIIIENNSQESETFRYYETLCDHKYKKENVCEGILAGGQKIKVVTWENGFNYSAINNYGVLFAKGEYLVLLNNDIELITEDWLEKMLGNCQRPEVGIVGARLYYPDDTIQHAGIVVGIDGIAANMFPGLEREQEGYLHKAAIQLNYSAVTAACLMVKRRAFKEVGGLEEGLAVAFNDVDFCLRIRQAGYLVVYNPWVEAYHYESKSRGKEDTKEKLRRFDEEIRFMRTRWIDILKDGDPYYNPNFSLKKCNYTLKPYK